MNCAFMERNSSIYLKNNKVLVGNIMLNFRIAPSNYKVFIMPHIKCIEKDLNADKISSYINICKNILPMITPINIFDPP
jgi:hypothetical protein